jgi:predicted enzyme related to lactoylglutathione lyase
MSPESVQQGVVVFVKRVKPLANFYRAVLGLETIEASSSHEVLRGPGIEVVVHGIPPAMAADITITSPPEVRAETPFKPTFVVSDLDVARAAATAGGGCLKPAEQAWHFRGVTVLDGWDPEGNIFQLKQSDSSGR